MRVTSVLNKLLALQGAFVRGVAFDEASSREGQQYLTVVADHETNDRVWIGEGRSQATVGDFFDEIGERAKQLEAGSLEMCAPYSADAKARAPQAEILDPSHVVKLASESLPRRTKHRAYGFHSFAALAAMVFLCCTDLQLNYSFEGEERS